MEQYNYVIEKKSALSDIDLLSNPAKLEFILKNFEKNDIVLLDQLQYYYTLKEKDPKSGKEIEKRQTPLHIAFNRSQIKSTNIILKYLAKLDYAQFKTFKDIFPDMIDYT